MNKIFYLKIGAISFGGLFISLVNICVKLLNIRKYTWNSQMYFHRLLWA